MESNHVCFVQNETAIHLLNEPFEAPQETSKHDKTPYFQSTHESYSLNEAPSDMCE